MGLAGAASRGGRVGERWAVGAAALSWGLSSSGTETLIGLGMNTRKSLISRVSVHRTIPTRISEL